MRGGLRNLIAAAAALAAAAFHAAPAGGETLTLTGVMIGSDHQTYREVPFHVPAGTTSVTVEFAYTGKAQRGVIDLGLRDPQRFRGWSGGNKSRFTVTETWATPSYLPGPLPAGDWRLILGVPNLRKDARAEYTAKITLRRDHAFDGFAEAPLRSGPAWYRGDLHLHTGHSDGSCATRTGARSPCPVHKVLEAAAARGLDFVAITEHNATSHHQALAELQPHFDDLLLIPGREITTFQGHLNVFGVTAPLDFQLGGPRTPSIDHILAQAAAAGGLASINHPALPSGEACMGCGWTAKTDFARIQAIEVVNGAMAEGPLSGMAFWEARLNAGQRITAIGGSDNHDPARAPGVGAPTTVVRAENLSQDAILAGLRAGYAFIDVTGTRNSALEVLVSAGDRRAGMGDVLAVAPGQMVQVEVGFTGDVDGRVVFAGPLAARIQPVFDAHGTWAFRADGRRGWLRVDVRGPDGRLVLIGNPVYLEPAAP